MQDAELLDELQSLVERQRAASQEWRAEVIFAARGLLVSLAFFAVVYCALSLLIVLLWRIMAAKTPRVLCELGEFPVWSADLFFCGFRSVNRIFHIAVILVIGESVSR